ncbi:MAG TPA: ribulose-phosphate 3-epimerase, partial [Armatimonadetes bacterium]|nr:ribulose-phosphate 3-epimerase [Armatimonadota bacterium]
MCWRSSNATASAVKLAPSMMCADFRCLEDVVHKLEDAGVDWLHFDVMDGCFVPNITFGPLVIEALRPVTQLPFDVHLMIANPERYVDAFAKAGADYITVHVEALEYPERVIERIRELG